MREMITHVSGVVAPVLICALIGYGLAKLKLPFDNKMIGALVSTVGYPTLILSHLAGQDVTGAATALRKDEEAHSVRDLNDL